MDNKKTTNYHDNLNIQNIVHLRELLSTLPPFVNKFFHGIEERSSTRTRVAYAYDLRVFFEWIHDNKNGFSSSEITSYEIGILDQISREDIQDYLSYCSFYEKDGKEYTNSENGKARKLATLKSFYNYYYTNELIKTNPAALVPMPKLHEKAIIRLDINEVATLLDQVEEGTKLTKKEAQYHNKTGVRDLAIMSLLLGTGIRVSEFVGLNINDIDYDNDRIKVRRKGGYDAYVYFGEEVHEALIAYKVQRDKIIPISGHEDAMFLSLQNRRITVRSVENLVKKYASRVTTMKKITPHKLRSTFGSNLYQESGDIYLVADVLGHKDVNTTQKHYAARYDEQGRRVQKMVHLRKD